MKAAAQRAATKPASPAPRTKPKKPASYSSTAKPPPIVGFGSRRIPQPIIKYKGKELTRKSKKSPGMGFVPLDSVTVPALFAAIASTGSIMLSCERLNINRLHVYALKASDEDFKKKLWEAQRLGVEAWKDEAVRRGFQGYDRPIYQQGVQVGSERVYSDTLAVLMLKAGDPETFKERTSTEHSLGGASPVRKYAHLDEGELNELINKKLYMLGAVTASRRKHNDVV